METYSIEAAVDKDIPALKKLVNSAYRGEAARRGWTHEADLIQGELRIDEDSLKDSIHRKGATILTYRLPDGVINACVYLEAKSSLMYLGMLCVDPELQATGIGKKLLFASEDHARKMGCSDIEMTVISQRKELIDWYRRHGYAPTGETRPFDDAGRFGEPREPIEFIVLTKKLSS
jgi:ribosomal protein S18 acetylase RimI-like enzyme